MRIIDLLSTDRIALGAQISDKEQAIDKLVELQMAGGCIADREAYRKAILAREEMSSTAIEQGIAVPHAKSDAVSSSFSGSDDTDTGRGLRCNGTDSPPICFL